MFQGRARGAGGQLPPYDFRFLFFFLYLFIIIIFLNIIFFFLLVSSAVSHVHDGNTPTPL